MDLQEDDPLNVKGYTPEPPPIPGGKSETADNYYDALNFPKSMRKPEPPKWEEVAPAIQEQNPGTHPDDLRKWYEHSRNIKIAEQQLGAPQPEDATEFLGRRSVPFASTGAGLAENIGYSEAQKRIMAGTASDEDYKTTVAYERRRQEWAKQGLGTKVAGGLAHIPAIAGEFMIGGAALKGAGSALGLAAEETSAVAVPRFFSGEAWLAAGKSLGSPAAIGKAAALTPLVPSMYVDRWAQGNMAEGRDPMDIRGLPSAYALGVLQVHVLGAVSQAGAGVPGSGLGAAGTRIGVGTVTGMGGQQLVDVGASAISEFLPKGYKLETGYGALGLAAQGKWGEAGEHLFVQATTFAVFSMLHAGGPGEPARPGSPEFPASFEAMAKALDAEAKKGMSPKAAAQNVGKAYDILADILKTNPNPSRAEVSKAMEGLPEGPVRDLGKTIADGFKDVPKNVLSPEAVNEIFGSELRGEGKPPERLTGPTAEAQQEKGKDWFGKPAEPQEAPPQAQAPQQPAQAPAVAPEPLGGLFGEPLARIPEARVKAWAKGAGYNVEGKSVQEIMKRLSDPSALGQRTVEDWIARQPENRVKPSQALPDKTPTEKIAPIKPPPDALDEPQNQGHNVFEPGDEEATRAAMVAAGKTEPASQVSETTPEPKAPARPALSPEEAKMTPAEAKAAAEALLKGNEPKGRTVSEEESNSIQAAKKNGKISDKEVLALSTLIEGGSLRGAADLLKSRGSKRSHEWVRTHANNALEKLKEADPDTWQGTEITREGFQAARDLRGAEQPGEVVSDKAVQAAIKAAQQHAEATDEEVDSADFQNKLDREALDHLLNHPDLITHAKEIQDAITADAKRSGLQPEALRRAIIAELRKSLADTQTRNAVEELQGPAPENAPREAPPERSGEAPGNELTPENAPGAKVPEPRPEPIDPIAEMAKDIAKDEAGTLNVTRVAEVAQQIGEHLKSAVQHVNDNLAELAGEMGPRTTRASQKAGEAMARFNAAPTFAREAAPYYIDQVMGEAKTQEARRLVGGVLTEMRLRHMLDLFQKQGDPEAAAEVKTLVGQKNSPFKTEADYQDALNNQHVKDAIQRFKDLFVPKMENNFRRAQGLEDTDPINSPTQIEGLPVNLKAYQEGEPDPTGSMIRMPSKGNLKNQRLGKLPFAKQATGAAEGYDPDLGAIITNSLARGEQLAAKAEMMRTLVEEGLAKFDKAGQDITRNGVKFIGDIKVEPPKGTQAAEPGQNYLYLDPRVYDEVRKSLDVDKPIKFFSGFNSILTRAALMSTVEAVYHAKNILTFPFKPGTGWTSGIADFIKNGIKVVSGDAQAKAQLVELARIGALKDPGMETGPMGKYNPLAYMGKFLDVMQRTMRLTANDAFDRLERSGRVEGSETNRRDFINQLGQYNRKAQNGLVRLFRDTGFGPFATAGTNYWMQGVRAMTMNPGVEATSPMHAIGLRAEMLAKTTIVLGGVALANYLMWKKVEGDDHTPIGAVKTGVDKEGRTTYMDLTNLTGLTRGMRQTGLLALAQGARKGEKLPATANKATNDIIHGLLHPFEGPAVSFLHTAATGENTIGMKIADKPKPGESIPWKNLQAALYNANPAVAVGTGKDRPKEKLAADRWWRLAGPFVPQTSHSRTESQRRGMHD